MGGFREALMVCYWTANTEPDYLNVLKLSFASESADAKQLVPCIK